MKFVFDECIPSRFVEVLRIVYPEYDSLIKHLVTDLGFGGVPDPIWLTKIGGGDPCILVTRDSAIRRVYAERAAWQRSGHVVFFLQNSWRHAKFDEQTWKLLRWWPRIIEASEKARAGVAYRIPFRAAPSSLYPIDGGDSIP